MKRSTLLVVLCFAAACRTAGPVPPAPPTPEAAALPGALHWFRTSAEYQAATIQTYREAAESLEEIARDLPAGTWAVSLDADETILDNSQYQKERAAQGLGYSSDSWAEWVRRKDAPAIPGAVSFLQRVHELGGKIAIITNRREKVCTETRDNLTSERLVYDVVLCQPDDDKSGEKEPRWEQVEKGTAAKDLPPLKLVMWIGDNIQDFPDQDQSLRGKPEDAFKDFGVRWFVLPNPMYGSWEKNPAN
ncbi:MAG TPA: HAD family acid phosphatase [Thermoanaerobaculia bacterium]|nr:HAD family acid phosphatase [Thermoanaerobaculia bacterium]